VCNEPPIEPWRRRQVDGQFKIRIWVDFAALERPLEHLFDGFTPAIRKFHMKALEGRIALSSLDKRSQ
jgi:hypothetical protein